MAELEKKEASFNAARSESGNKQAFYDKKEADRELRKLENRISKTESDITGLEKQIQTFELAIANPLQDPDLLKSADFYSNYESLQNKLKECLAVWEQLQIELEQLKTKRN